MNWNTFAVVNGVVNAVASASTDDVVVVDDVVVDVVGGRKYSSIICSFQVFKIKIHPHHPI